VTVVLEHPNGFPARLKRPLAATLYRSGLAAAKLEATVKDRALILMYHRVLLDHEVSCDIHPGMYVTRRSLEMHLRYLSERFQFVSLERICAWREGRDTFERTPCAITFDDGWEDNHRNAFDLLKSYGAPATIFLVTEQIGSPGMMTWNQIREMEEQGIWFGSHTATHPLLPTLGEKEIRWQLSTSRRTLHEKLRHPSICFCYPNGDHSPEAVRLASEYYGAAVRATGGPATRNDHPFLMSRIAVHNDVAYTLPLFVCRIAGIF